MIICNKRTENHNFTITTNTSQHVEFFHSLIFIIITSRNEVVAKVTFLHLSAILFTGGVSASMHAGIPPPWEQTPPRADTPQEQTPPEQTPPGSRHPPGSRPPRADTPWEQTPPRADTPPGSRLWHTVNERPVCILLECILVLYQFQHGSSQIQRK